MTQLLYTVYPWKFGVLIIAATPNGICRIDFGNSDDVQPQIAMLEAETTIAIRDDNHFKSLCCDLDRYFAGEEVHFCETLDLSSGTVFQKRVWQELMKISYGQMRTYGEIAKAIGKPKAVRAVGAANGANPIPILIPCHRVIQTGGKLGGYGGGLNAKDYLLRLEGAIV